MNTPSWESQFDESFGGTWNKEILASFRVKMMGKLHEVREMRIPAGRVDWFLPSIDIPLSSGATETIYPPNGDVGFRFTAVLNPMTPNVYVFDLDYLDGLATR